MNKFFVSGLIGIFFISSLSCGKKKKGEIIAEVDGIKITREEVELQMPSGTRNNPNVFNNFKKYYIRNVLFYKAAEDEGLTKDPELQRKLKVEKIKIISRAYLDKKLSSVNVSQDELEREFEAKKDYFSRNFELVLLYFTDTTRKELFKNVLKLRGWRLQREVRKLLEAGEISGFDTIRSNLGELYLNLEEEIADRVFDAIANLKEGEVSEPIDMGGGFYVYIKLLKETREEYNPDSLKSLLRDYLLEKKRKKMEDSLYNFLLTKYKVREVLQ